jgi:hypothetical protein
LISSRIYVAAIGALRLGSVKAKSQAALAKMSR